MSDGAQRADELDEMSAIVSVFVRAGSPRAIAVWIGVVGCVRVAVGDWSWVDAVVAAAVILFVGPVEWLLHERVLHGRTDTWLAQRLGSGNGHREHHLDPPALRWLLLRPVDALAFGLLVGAVVSGVLAVGLAIVGGSVAAAFTGAFVALVALLHYEWTHLLIHTRYRPKTRRYQQLARNHRLHHYRNEHYWLGVTSNLGDRLRSTAPKDRSSVPLSDTARSLG